jgi:hypothetical protein
MPLNWHGRGDAVQRILTHKLVTEVQSTMKCDDGTRGTEALSAGQYSLCSTDFNRHSPHNLLLYPRAHQLRLVQFGKTRQCISPCRTGELLASGMCIAVTPRLTSTWPTRSPESSHPGPPQTISIHCALVLHALPYT